MKKCWLILMMVLFPVSQVLANDDFDGFDSVEQKLISADCPVGPYPIQPIGPVAGSFNYSNGKLTIWRYPCSRESSAIIATAETSSGTLSGGFLFIKELESSGSNFQATAREYRTGPSVVFLEGGKSYVLDVHSSVNINAALLLSTSMNLTVIIPAYRASDYFPESPTTGPTRDHTGQWGTVGEGGWGLTVIQGFTSNARYTFVPWYTYDKTGKNAWYLFQGDTWTATNVFSADVYSYSGPAFGPTYNESQFSGSKVGTAKLTFNSATSARFEYTVDGISRSINLYKLE
jgi:hypothetical protein